MKVFTLTLLTFAVISAGACNQVEEKPQEMAQVCCGENNMMATCTGSKNCTACKNCKYCKHCSKNGGSCGVCK